MRFVRLEVVWSKLSFQSILVDVGLRLNNLCICVFVISLSHFLYFNRISLIFLTYITLLFKFSRNNQLVFYAEVGRIGIGICYDIRFQELAAIYAARGMILFLPLYKHWFLYASLSIVLWGCIWYLISTY